MCVFEVFIGALVFVHLGLQPRNRSGLLCVTDGKSHGEGIREGGEW